jgi:hypothetical protein
MTMLRLSDIKEGDKLIAGKGMSCLDAGDEVKVFRAERQEGERMDGGGLAVTCRAQGGTTHLLAPGASKKDGAITQFSRAPAKRGAA